MKTLLTKLVAVAFVLIVSIPAAAQDSLDVIVLQGVLMTANGTPRPDGNYSISVSLFDVPNGGSPISTVTNVSVKQEFGAFTAELSRAIVWPHMHQLGKRTIDPKMSLWWSVSIDGAELKPRLRIAAVPLASTARYAEKSAGEIPVGSIIPFAGDTSAMPSGWLVCDGNLVSAVEYPSLAMVIGTRYNDDGGEAAEMFRLPDLRGMVVVGMGTNRLGDPVVLDAPSLPAQGNASRASQRNVNAGLPQIELLYIIRAW